MMSTSSLSARIRAKKKEQMDTPPDATDILVAENQETGEALSENDPVPPTDHIRKDKIRKLLGK